MKALVRYGMAAGVLLVGPVFAEEPDLDPELPEYEAVSGIDGNITSVGSDTLNNLMSLWAEEFQGVYPNVAIEVQGAGSSTAPPALAQGTANFGPMSREMRSSEIQDFEEDHGYPPTAVPVAIDMVAVFVNRDNPVEGMTIEEVDAVFSETRRCGHPEDITRWGQLGLEGGWADRDFTLYSRNAVSGTYGYFRENALCDGDSRDTINEQPGSAAVVDGVAESRNGIGYSGIGYRTSGVRAIPIAPEGSTDYAEPTPENAATGDFPLARFLYVYVNKHPNRELDPLEAEFLRLVLSREGQDVVRRDGFVPLPEQVAGRERERLGLD